MDLGAVKTDLEAVLKDVETLVAALAGGSFSTALTDAEAIAEALKKVVSDLA